MTSDDGKADRTSGGLQFRQAHFPGRAPIDAYGNGGFRFADMSHRGSILVLPSGIHGWEIEPSVDLDTRDFQAVFEESKAIEILLIGTGPAMQRLPEVLRAEFRAHGIMADAMSTGAAVRTFNVLLAENRAVAAALVAVD